MRWFAFLRLPSERDRVMAAVLVMAMCWVTSCAGGRSEWRAAEGRISHMQIGYSIPDLARREGGDPADAMGWNRVRVPEADLAFRADDRSYVAISSRCDVEQTEPQLLARQLLIGLKKRIKKSEASFDFAGGKVFSQVFAAEAGDSSVYAKTVTWLRGGCIVDWYLVTTSPPDRAESAFDSWWQGFDPGSIPESTGEAL